MSVLLYFNFSTWVWAGKYNTFSILKLAYRWKIFDLKIHYKNFYREILWTEIISLKKLWFEKLLWKICWTKAVMSKNLWRKKNFYCSHQRIFQWDIILRFRDSVCFNCPLNSSSHDSGYLHCRIYKPTLSRWRPRKCHRIV